MSQSSFDFPGFLFIENQDTLTHHVVVGTIGDGGTCFTVTMVRNKKFPNLNFLISRVNRDDGTLLWDFKEQSWSGIGVLAKAHDQTVIALRGSGKNSTLKRIIPFRELDGQRSDLRALIALKQAAAEYLECDYTLSDTEKVVAKADEKKARQARTKAREARNAEALAAIDAKVAAREELVRTVLARGKITGYTTTGDKRYGYPVLESEWQRLSHGVYVIMVSSIDESGTPGQLLEAFQVIKEHGKNPVKRFAMHVTAEEPTKKLAPQIVPLRTRVVEMDDGVYEVQIYASMDAIRDARANGLNSGTFVAVDTNEPRFDVLSVYRDRIESIGRFAALD